MNLRPYQQEARERIHDEWSRVNRTLLVLPTGTGKTVVFSQIAKDVIHAGGQALIMAHRGELLQQAADKLYAATGMRPAVEKAEQTAHDAFEMVTVASVQSICRPDRLARFSQEHFSHIIIDEAHHATSDTYQAPLRYFANAKVLGVTATPDRADMKNLGAYFDTLAYEYTIIEAIRDGWLVPIRAQTLPIQIDISQLRPSDGKFKDSDVDTALGPYLDAITAELIHYAPDRKTIVFTPLVDTARKLAAKLQAAGLNAKWVSGDDPERHAKLTWYAGAGRGAILLNSMLLTEGYDDPATDQILILRATESRSLYSQMVGRGTRLHPGKVDLRILDALFLTERLELCRPAHLIAATPEEAKAMQAAADRAGTAGMELNDEAIREAQEEVIRQREEALAAKLREQRNRKRQLVDPLQWAVSINASDLTDYVPTFGWEAEPPTKSQIDALEKAGIATDDVTNQGMAAKLLDRVNARKAGKFASPRQIRFLERMGFRHVGAMKASDAGLMISRIEANGWRVPDDLARMVKR